MTNATKKSLLYRIPTIGTQPFALKAKQTEFTINGFKMKTRKQANKQRVIIVKQKGRESLSIVKNSGR